MKYNTEDLRIEKIKAVATPAEICEEIMITEKAAETTHAARSGIQ